ncbi:hypothetical protein L1I30_11925, partial [Gillisia sp. M10.2A]
MGKTTPTIKSIIFIFTILGFIVYPFLKSNSHFEELSNSEGLHEIFSAANIDPNNFEERNHEGKNLSLVISESVISTSKAVAPPTITLGTNPEVCKGVTTADLTYSNTTGNPTKYSINYNSSAEGQGFADVNNINLPSSPIQLTVPAGAATGTYSATLTVSTASETSSNYTISVKVKPLPGLSAISNITTCTNNPIAQINFSSSTTGTTYAWTNNRTSIGLAANGTGNIAGFSPVNNTNTPITAKITVTPTANNCTGTAKSFNIVVNPKPSVNQPTDIIVCNGESIPQINLSGSAVAGTTYSWTNDKTSIGLAASSTGNISSFTATNTSSSPVTATISVTPSATSCNGDVKTFKITVNPTPTVTKPDDIVVCNGETISQINLSGSAVAGTTYSWT